MVWGCMSSAGIGKLHFINGIMDKHMYIEILRQNLTPSVEKLNISDDFYQDNDPKHSAHIVKEWLLYNCPQVIEMLSKIFGQN